MVVLINAASAKMGGAAVYIENLLRALAAQPADDFVVLTPPARARALDNLPPNVRLVATDAGQRSFFRRVWWDQVTLRRILRREGADVLYSSANFGMFLCPCKQLLLVRMPLYFSRLYLTRILPRHGWRYRLQFNLRRWMTCQSARTADLVMTPSRSLLEDLTGFVRLRPECTFVNPYGTLTDRFGAPSYRSRQPGTLTLLHVSHYADHKNLAVVFRAIRILRTGGFEGVRFQTTAIIDDPRYPVSVCRSEDLALLNDPLVRPSVDVLGDVAYDQLPALYATADCFIFPSVAESFGHPMIEAMASGLPSIAADVPINREILGDAALYFDPYDAEALSRCIEQVAREPEVAAGLRSAARTRAKAFQWCDHVRRLVARLKALADDPGRLPAQSAGLAPP